MQQHQKVVRILLILILIILFSNLAFASTLCNADFNNDGAIDSQDLGILKNNFGLSNVSHYQGDANSDKIADGQDFTILKSNYGRNNCNPRCSPLNSSWNETTRILGEFDRAKNIQYLSVLDNFLIARGGALGTHSYERVLIKDFLDIKIWGGEIKVNLAEIQNDALLSSLVFLGGYADNSTVTRNFAIGTYYDRYGVLNSEKKNAYYVYIKAYQNDNYPQPTLNQVFYLSNASFPSEIINIKWCVTGEKLYAGIDNNFKEIPTGQNKNINFKRIDLGWVSSYNSGLVKIKNIILYNESCVPEWILE